MKSAHQPKEIHEQVVRFIDSGRSFALVTILKADGSTPQEVGAKAVIDHTGKISGTIGGGQVEAEAQRRTIEACKLKQPAVFDFQLAGAGAHATEPLCGGAMRLLIDTTVPKNRNAYAHTAEALRQHQKGVLITRISGTHKPKITVQWFSQADMPADTANAEAIRSCLKREAPLLLDYNQNKGEISTEVFIEPIVPKPRLLIAGGGHIGQALTYQAVPLGFDITVMDDRREFTNKVLFPEGVATLCGDIPQLITDFSIARDTYIVIVTRGHKKDAEALEACIHSSAAYIGMIGSKRKVALMRESFIASGIATDRKFDRVFAPVGLDIGAVTVEEIATSIMAQLIAVRRKGDTFANPKDMRLL
jgi:xanthine dehydrogenase accessory factor